MIADWQPLHALPAGLWGAWIASFGLVAVTMLKLRSQVPIKYVVVTAFLGLMSLRVSRLDAFFALAAALLIAPALGAQLRTPLEAPSARDRRSRPLAFVFAGCVVVTIVLALPRILTVPMGQSAMPDARVASYVREQALRGTVLTWFDWGQYTIWHFGGDLKVSMDGRRETVYSDTLVSAHMRFYFGEEDASQFADALRPDYVWLPKTLRAARELQRSGWRTLCEGPSSVLLARGDDRQPCSDAFTAASRSFPQL
jgi:hypothetical protein